MMIQPIGVSQSYGALARTGQRAASAYVGDASPQQSVDSAAAKESGRQEVAPKADSISFSLAGVTAYANHALREKAVSQINRILQELDPQATPVEELDPAAHTPEKTAEYIVAASTGFFDAYSAGHPEMEEVKRLDGFMELISGSIKRGLEEAKELLDGLNLLNGLVEEGIAATDSLIWEKLDQFYQQQVSNRQEDSEPVLSAAA